MCLTGTLPGNSTWLPHGKACGPGGRQVNDRYCFGCADGPCKIPIYIIIIVVIKEALMTLGGYLIYKNKRHVVSANWYGKLSTAIFNVAIVLLIIGAPYGNIIISIAVATLLHFYVFACIL